MTRKEKLTYYGVALLFGDSAPTSRCAAPVAPPEHGAGRDRRRRPGHALFASR
jgi:hypothetical protein